MPCQGSPDSAVGTVQCGVASHCHVWSLCAWLMMRQVWD